jgi:hypothetical protein
VATTPRPSKPVLQGTGGKLPFKKPPGAKGLPKGGPSIQKGFPGVPGDPSAGGQTSPQPAADRSIVDASGLYSVTHYTQGAGSVPSEAESTLYGSGPGCGPQADIRPPTPETPPHEPLTGGAARPAATASTPGKYAR